MGNTTSHEPLDESGAEFSVSEQTMTETPTEIVQNGPTLGKPNSVENKSDTDIRRIDYLVKKLHLKSGKAKVDSGADVKQDTGTYTSEATMEKHANTNAEEKEIEKSAKTVSKSRFSMAFSRSVPGRTNDPSPGPLSGTAILQTNQESVSVNTASVDKVNLQESSTQRQQQQPATESSDAPEHAVNETKQKEVSFFEKLFKQGDKGKQQNENQGNLKTAGSQDPVAADCEATELIHRLDNVEHYLETGDSNKDYTTPSHGNKESQNSTSKSSENLQEPEKDNKVDTPADDKSVMNFFKTLVTPTKSSSKAELDSQQISDDKKKVSVEQKEAAAKSHKSEQKAADQEIPKTNDAEFLDKAKLEKTPTQSPFGKLFKQKTSKEVPQDEQETLPAEKSDKITSQSQKRLSKQEDACPESAQKLKTEEEEVKPTKKGFLNFFKQTPVKEDEKHADSMDSTVKGSEAKDSSLADDLAKKGVETRENTPAKKGKDNSKQKKSATEGNQAEPQRAKSMEDLPPAQQQNAASVPIPNGNDIKVKRTPGKGLEKKQSFGVFLKQLGGKKTADVAVQTDPVVISPAGKTK
ncbi:breast carcinoma-amplified sequence 1-like isoform X2 [Chiloscyllium plagiosum]|uniref:breast carcinoma-amplified sequence 1-like isoform X2 n=1 Tax=Chiloscyllium plagiosum TaxID=36176 RepID=UPI001CB85061|nr:breast carcinoma-amplified sequence 1-like isoform X2 [Chiloscyllium plagiosum]